MEDVFEPDSGLHNPTLDVTDSVKKEKVSSFLRF